MRKVMKSLEILFKLHATFNKCIYSCNNPKGINMLTTFNLLLTHLRYHNSQYHNSHASLTF